MPDPVEGVLGLSHNVHGGVKNSFTMNRIGAGRHGSAYSSLPRVIAIDASVLVRVHS